MIIIDSKLPSYKSALSENNAQANTSKTSIDQSAIGNTEQTNVTLDMSEESTGEHERNDKKKQQHDEDKEDEQTKKDMPKLSNAQIKTRNLKLLNLI